MMANFLAYFFGALITLSTLAVFIMDPGFALLVAAFFGVLFYLIRRARI